jgi:excinuclease UvrABC nuclease subunit
MIFLRNWYRYDAGMVAEYVPPTSGVYMLFSHQDCVYVGSSRNLQAELTGYFDGSSKPRFAQHPPDEFRFEVVLGPERDLRRAELIAELSPACRD